MSRRKKPAAKTRSADFEPFSFETPRARWCRRCLLSVILLLPIVGVSFSYALSCIDPAFYRERLQLDPDARHEWSNQFLNKSSRLLGDVQNASSWQVEFTEDQMNGWLAEDFQSNHASKTLPPGVSEPRVQHDGDRLRVAFRYRQGPISTVVQVGVRVWVPKSNLLAIELDSARAGMLPLPTTYARKLIEDCVRSQSLDVTWKRNGGALVALVDFERAKRQITLQKTEVRDGSLVIQGLSGRHAIPRTDYAPTAN